MFKFYDRTSAMAASISALFTIVCVPPNSIKTRQEQMEINRSAILISTALLFVARAIEFKLNELLAAFLISSGLAAFTYIFDWTSNLFVKRGRGRTGSSTDRANKWATFLIAVWILSLVLAILAAALNILFGLSTLANFLRGTLNAAIFISIVAIALVMLKTKFHDHKKIGSLVDVFKYLFVGVIFNSVMLYFFVYLTW